MPFDLDLVTRVYNVLDSPDVIDIYEQSCVPVKVQIKILASVRETADVMMSDNQTIPNLYVSCHMSKCMGACIEGTTRYGN